MIQRPLPPVRARSIFAAAALSFCIGIPGCGGGSEERAAETGGETNGETTSESLDQPRDTSGAAPSSPDSDDPPALADRNRTGNAESAESADQAPPTNVQPAESEGAQAIALPRLEFEVPVEWRSEPPSNSMRAGQFRLPVTREGSEEEPALLVVFDFGSSGAGPVEANLERWAGQLSQPDGSSTMEHAKREIFQKEDCTVHYLEATGTFVAETTPGSGVRVNKPDWKLIAAIVETGRGPYYFKLTGDSSVVDPWRDAVMRMIDSFTVPG